MLANITPVILLKLEIPFLQVLVTKPTKCFVVIQPILSLEELRVSVIRMLTHAAHVVGNAYKYVALF